jgi:hypothetical protein
MNRPQTFAIYLFVIAGASAYYLLNAALLLGHYDLGWHLAAGDLIRAQGAVPLRDPWSFTAGDRQWFNLSWLWDVLASLVFQAAGFRGLIACVIACGAAIAGMLTAICLRTGASPLAVCISVLAACLPYPAFAAFPNIYLAASPNMVTMLLAVMFYGACLKPGRHLLLLPAAMLLWANLHGGFLLGLYLIAFFGVGALLRRDWRNVRLYALAGIGCLAATCVNPLGWHIYAGATATVGNFVQDYITEWWPYYRNVTMPGSLPGMIFIVAFVALELGRWKSGPMDARLLSWLFLFLGFYQFRYMAFFFLFATVPMALHLDRLLAHRRDSPATGKALLFAGIVAACALPLAWLRLDPGLELPQMISNQDVRYLQSHVPHARLLNHWNYGGLLIFRSHGTLPIFVDGRASTAYPDTVLRDYFKLAQQEVRGADWDAVLAKYRINTVLWVRAHQELRDFLVGKRGWKEVYTGQYASLYVKP